jgi:hypothetical protein
MKKVTLGDFDDSSDCLDTYLKDVYQLTESDIQKYHNKYYDFEVTLARNKNQTLWLSDIFVYSLNDKIIECVSSDKTMSIEKLKAYHILSNPFPDCRTERLDKGIVLLRFFIYVIENQEKFSDWIDDVDEDYFNVIPNDAHNINEFFTSDWYCDSQTIKLEPCHVLSADKDDRYCHVLNYFDRISNEEERSQIATSGLNEIIDEIYGGDWWHGAIEAGVKKLSEEFTNNSTHIKLLKVIQFLYNFDKRASTFISQLYHSGVSDELYFKEVYEDFFTKTLLKSMCKIFYDTDDSSVLDMIQKYFYYLYIPHKDCLRVMSTKAFREFLEKIKYPKNTNNDVENALDERIEVLITSGKINKLDILSSSKHKYEAESLKRKFRKADSFGDRYYRKYKKLREIMVDDLKFDGDFSDTEYSSESAESEVDPDGPDD